MIIKLYNGYIYHINIMYLILLDKCVKRFKGIFDLVEGTSFFFFTCTYTTTLKIEHARLYNIIISDAVVAHHSFEICDSNVFFSFLQLLSNLRLRFIV